MFPWTRALFAVNTRREAGTPQTIPSAQCCKGRKLLWAVRQHFRVSDARMRAGKPLASTLYRLVGHSRGGLTSAALLRVVRQHRGVLLAGGCQHRHRWAAATLLAVLELFQPHLT